ncbi:XRE family transcriptional regulator [Vogesella mureinivorans]|uniref:XRE family transcriptional regulator n=1 Tax=Vogesella mureinivorans TaxID=657276 RepID=UPI0011C8FF4D|nr:helix-turn-helix transcriptional regulator [Vogesella mureinivorans]
MNNLKAQEGNRKPVSTYIVEPENERLALGERIRSARTALGVSRNEAANVVGVSLSTFQAWEAGEREPDATKLSALARHYGLAAEWVLFGAGPMLAASGVPAAASAGNAQAVVDTRGNPVDLSEFVFIPRYNLKAAAGHGAVVDDETPMFSMAFRRYWVENYLHAYPADLAVISVKGDSMEGVLNNKDVILLNTADNQPTSGLYVLRVEGDLIVKRVQRLPGGTLRVISANDAYPTFEVDLNSPPADFDVIGRVVWYGRQT